MRHRTAVLLAWFVLATPAWAQGYDPQMAGLNRDISFIIRGRILFDPQVPPSGPVEVRLEGMGRDAIASVYADGIGNFEFKISMPARSTSSSTPRALTKFVRVIVKSGV